MPDFVKTPEIGQFCEPILVRARIVSQEVWSRLVCSLLRIAVLPVVPDQTRSWNVLKEVEGLSASVVVDRSETKGPRGVD